MTEPADLSLDRLRAVAATSNLRSPWARWLSAHHDEFEKLLRDYRPRWEALVEQAAADGFLTLPPAWHSPDEKVRDPARRRVVKAAMRTWERVKGRHASEDREADVAPAQSPPPRQAIQPARQIGQTMPTPHPGNNPDGGLEDVLKAMDAKKGQMPKPFKPY